MLGNFLVIVSILFQLATAFLALRLINKMGRQLSWILIALAMVLQASRRVLTLIGLISGKILFSQIVISEWMGLAISVFMFFGVAGLSSYLIKGERDRRERNKAEKALAENEEKYRYMFANNPQPMWIYDLETLAFLEVNESAIQYYGYSREEFLAMTLKDIRPPEDIDALLKDVEKTRRSYNPAGEWRHLKKNGELISVVIISHTITFRNRKARHVMITDITEQKNADDKIKDSEEKFRSLFTKSPLGIAYNEMILDKDGKAVDYRFLEVNDAYKKIIGIDPTGKKVTEAFPGIENYSFNWIGTFGHVATKGEKIHFEQFFENTGRWYDCVAFQSRINQYAVVFQDITERRNAEEEIHRLSERISTATRAAQLGIWDWDVENNKLVWDDQMYQLYGLKKEVFSVAYDAWLRGLHPDDRAFSQEASEMALRKEKDYDTEFRVVWPDGSLHVLKAKGDVFLNDEGKPVRMTGVNYDITEIRSITEKIKKLNEELEIRVKERTSQLEASNKELEAFSYSVSHDLRSPLRHINGFAEILTKQYSENLPDEARNYINTIVGSAKKMGILIDDLLSFSRAGRAELKKSLVKMNLIVDDAVLHLKPSFSDRKVELSISSLPEVYGDYNLLRMVWINLLDNALKYSLPREVAEIRIGYKEEENEFVFYTQDNGVGFDMKYAQKLFGVFQRLHSSAQFDGTGIGLANVQRIILRHGGRTWAEAETDKGATFYFSIPK